MGENHEQRWFAEREIQIKSNSHLVGWQKILTFACILCCKAVGKQTVSFITGWCYIKPFLRRGIWWDQPKVLLFCLLASIQLICPPDSTCTYTQRLTHTVIHCLHSNKSLETTQVFIIGAGWLNYSHTMNNGVVVQKDNLCVLDDREISRIDS